VGLDIRSRNLVVGWSSDHQGVGWGACVPGYDRDMQKAKAPAKAPRGAPRSEVRRSSSALGASRSSGPSSPRPSTNPFPGCPRSRCTRPPSASLTIGLGLLVRDLRRPPQARLIAITGAVLTVVGLVTAFPLIPVGLGFVAIGLIGARYPRAATWSLLVGLAGMVILYVALYQQQVGRVFGEGAPPFQPGPKITFQACLILIAVGLAAIGFQLLRRNE
jgi:hypothetical protein